MAGSSSYSKNEQILNVLSHLLGFMGALLGLVLLLAKAEGGLAVSAVAIYGGSMALLFLASCLYHAVSEVRWQARLKLFDHAAIYLLIAGTYTPILLLAFDGWLSWVSMLVIWLLAVVGIAFKLLTGVRFPKLSLGTYLVMGWLARLVTPPRLVASLMIFNESINCLVFSRFLLMTMPAMPPRTATTATAMRISKRV